MTLKVVRLRAQLADVDAVALDASAPGTSEDDGLLVEAALAEGVPVVVEHADREKMASLARIGVDAETAVIESRAEGGEMQITLVGGPEPTVQTGPKKEVAPPAQRRPENKKLKEELEQYDAQQKAARTNEPRQALAAAASQTTSAQKAATVEAIISEKAFKKGARRHGTLITGKCTTGKQCVEGSVNLRTVNICPEGSCTNTLTPLLDYGIYKSVRYDSTTGKNRPYSAIVLRPGGRPNLTLQWDNKQNRGYYLDGWSIQLAATAFPANMDWRLHSATPENANRQTSVAYTSGFTVGGVANDPAALSISYSNSEQRTVNTEEFGVTRVTSTSPTNSVTWNHKMQLNGKGENYNQVNDIFIHYILAGTIDVNLLPTIAKAGTEFRAEAIWDGYRDASCGKCYVSFSAAFSLQMQHAWVETAYLNSLARATAYTRSATIPDTMTFGLTTNW